MSKSTGPTPLDMPGAATTAVQQSEETATATDTAKADVVSGLGDAERSELEQLRSFKQASRDWEGIAKDNLKDASQFRKLAESFGVDDSKAFDAQEAFSRLQQDIANERAERLRTEIAAAAKVPVSQVHGTTAEEMRASAQDALEWAQEFAKQYNAGKAPIVAPASTVTSSEKTTDTGVKQIESREQLKSMTPQQIIAARKEGRLDRLMGKK